MNRLWLLFVFMASGILADDKLLEHAQDKLLRQAPSAQVPQVTEVLFSESIPQWTPPLHNIGFEVSARHEAPPHEAKHYPFPHGITFRCQLPYPSALTLSYHEEHAPDEELWLLPELAFNEKLSSKIYKEGYFMIQWLKMEAGPDGIVLGEALVSVVPPEAWRGRTKPGESGSVGVQFLLNNLSLNPLYWNKKYKGPGQPRSSAYTFTVQAGK